VTLNGGTQSASTNTITFTEPNGTYSFTVGSVSGYTANPASGTVTVSGGVVTQGITFSSSVSSSATSYFQTSGLVVTATSGFEGGGWEVLTGAALAVESSTAVSSSNFYNSTNPNCHVTWIGTPQTSFTFPATSASATVGTSNAWLFDLTQSGGGSALVVTVADGAVTLQYTVSPGGCANSGSNQAIPSGIVDSSTAVSAANSNGGSAFLGSYPSATKIWNVISNTTLSAPQTFWAVVYTTCPLSGGSGSGHEFVADVDAVSGVVDYSGSSVLTCGPPRAMYTVTFTETGLPSGTTWSVTLNGTTVPSTSATIVFSEANGTYAYTVVAISGYTVNPSSGTMTVTGAGVVQSVTFTAQGPTTYAVTFTETGLPTGTSWSVSLNGATDSSTSNAITFSEPNGPFQYTVGSVGGYTANPASGTVTVAGAAQAIGVTFSATGGGSGSSGSGGFLGLSGSTGYYLLGAIVAIVVIGIAVAVLVRSRRGGRGAGPPGSTGPGYPGMVGPGAYPQAPPPPMPPPPSAGGGTAGPPPYAPPPNVGRWEPPPSGVSGTPPYAPPMPAVSRSRFCPACGQPFTGSERFCASCGTPR